MRWFKHFSGAHDNNDLTKVRMRYGADGYAIYWYCLELISGDLGAGDDINFELKHDAEVIGFNLKIDTARVEEIMLFMVHLELFDNAQGAITCIKLAKYLDKKNTRNKHIHDIIDAAYVSATIPDSPPTVTDNSRLSPLDLDLDLDIKRYSAKTDVSEQFETFWKSWPKGVGEKGNKKRAKAQFMKLTPSPELFTLMASALESQALHKFAAKAEGKFYESLQHAERWIRDESWNTEVSEENPREELIGI